ncbi:hypothetical protein [Natrinema marinum]|uniref:hypothetical protein n=1 Tax=Natrinema marinum TaxID=2961598 RepID=UPI0020C90033|nr:hypothetical protein [Natrinema marinum]
MRFKPVPEPPDDLAFVETVHLALPETAGAVDDCCAHLLEETSIVDRDEAATWLVFLRALELAAEEPAGYRRRRPGPGDAATALERDRLRRAFRERVAGAEAVLAALDGSDRPLTAAAVGDALCEDGSNGEQRPRRHRIRDDRVERLLEWAVLLGLAERAESGYRLARGREEN